MSAKISCSGPGKPQKGFRAQVLGMILAFVLLLISVIFLLIYHTVEKHLLKNAYSAELENARGISSTLNIMSDTAAALLLQMNNDPQLVQLIYSINPEKLSDIRSLQLLQNYAEASHWINSAYVYNARQEKVAYTYLSNGYHLSFCGKEDFFDVELLSTLTQADTFVRQPILRQTHYPLAKNSQYVFTYYLPVQNRAGCYDGLFVLNLRADWLLELCANIGSSTSRQIVVTDLAQQWYIGDTVLLQPETLRQFGRTVAADTEGHGYQVLQQGEERYFCTWVQAQETQLWVLVCIPFSDIENPLGSLQAWFVVFYCVVFIFSVICAFLLSWRISRQHTTLQKLLEKEKLRSNGEEVHRADLLRSFLLLDTPNFIVGSRFQQADISLEEYTAYSLLLIWLKPCGTAVSQAAPTAADESILIRALLAEAMGENHRFELTDMLQNRFLLIAESLSPTELEAAFTRFQSHLPETGSFTAYGIYQANLSQLHQVPAAYRQLSIQLGQLYFYSGSCCLSGALLTQRPVYGLESISGLCSELVKVLCAQQFDQAGLLLEQFFQHWYEPAQNIPLTIGKLAGSLFEYISTFTQAYAVSFDLELSRFLADCSGCSNIREVQLRFLGLLRDLRVLLEGIHHRKNYIDELMDLLHEQYADPTLNADALAESIGLSAAYLRTVFKTATGINLAVYLRRYRLKKAAELLKETDRPINEIAEVTGFSSTNYFHTAFKKQYLLTPNEYRQHHRKSES